MHCAAARSRRRHPRQDGDDGAGAADAIAHVQPAQEHALARRLLCRLGRSGRRRHGARRHRQPDGRFCDPAGVVLRGLWLQADAGAHPARRRADAVAHARHGGRAQPLGRGLGAAHRLHGGVRARRSRQLWRQPGKPARDCAAGPAGGAPVRFRAHACVGRRRPGAARGLLGAARKPWGSRRRGADTLARRRHRRPAPHPARGECALLRAASACLS